MPISGAQDRIRRPNLDDVAREAGVGVATVGRVVNARGKVSNDKIQRVLLAARKLGYDRSFATPYHALVRIEVILVRPDTEYFARLNEEFLKLSQKVDPLTIVHRSFVDEGKPSTMAKRIREIALARAGLIVVGQDDPEIAEAVNWARSQGIPVVLLVSPISGAKDVPYVGIDNFGAGRTAGYFMRSMLRNQKGNVITLSHSGLYGNHRQRIAAFSEYFKESDENHHLTCCVMGGDSNEITELALKEVLSKVKNVVGIYNAGGAQKGVERALRHHKRLSQIIYIGHDLSPETRRLLKSNAMFLTIDQMPEQQAQRSIELLERLIGLHVGEPDFSPVPFRLVTKENLSV
jgi:LacI family transcriptional regulator